MSGSQVALILAMVAVLVGGVAAWLYFGRPEKEIAAAVIAGIATVLASVTVVAITQYNTKVREIREAHRVRKAEVYSEFSDLVFQTFALTKLPAREDLTDEEKAQERSRLEAQLQQNYLSFSKKQLLWGAPEVSRRWLEFKRYAQTTVGSENVEDGLRTLLYMDDVFRAIRDDLELSNDGLAEGDLVKHFLINPDELNRVIGSR